VARDHRFEANLFQIQNDIGDILHDTRQRGELVLCASNSSSGNGCSSNEERKNATQRISDGVAIAGLKGFSDNLA